MKLLNLMAVVGLIQSSEDCGAVEGGFSEAWFAEYKDITSFGFTSNVLTSIVTPGSVFKKYVPDSDDTAFYNQTGSRGDSQKYINTQQAFLKFKSLSQAKMVAGNTDRKNCSVIGIYFMNDCTVQIQGLDFDESCGGGGAGAYKETKTKCVMTPSALGNTGASVSALQYSVDSVGNTLIPVDETVITRAYMATL